MTEYEMNWQADSYREKYELLNAKVQEFDRYLNDPMMLSFHIVSQAVKGKFDELFEM